MENSGPARAGSAGSVPADEDGVARSGEPSPQVVPPADVFPIVGVGASAGGLEAMRQLFGALPPDTGMGFVVIQHLDPERPSMLVNILSTVTRMPVVEAADGMPVEANRVHVIPPAADLIVRGGVLALVPRSPDSKVPHLPVDRFFEALARDRPGAAVAVVLSGSGSDGTEGLRAVKAEEGITFAQDPASAPFGGMPESAIAAGVVDFFLAPAEIAQELTRLGRHPYLREGTAAGTGAGAGVAGRDAPASMGRERDGDGEERLGGILGLIRKRTDNDFAGYKKTTVLRRVQRRMALRRKTSLSEYEEYLRGDPEEVGALARDILVHVTSFFRDAAAFDALRRSVLPQILAHNAECATVRVWVPGCSTGEEVYSIAICILEALEDHRASAHVSVKIFGSDLSQEAVEVARRGVYSASAVGEISPERVARFFERVEDGFRIGKAARSLCIFVRHDMVRDPPFARLDLISCRNVLIYFDADLQRRIVPLLHHCLNRPGYLFLGRSEMLNAFRHLFAPVDGEHRIFAKVGESPHITYPVALSREAEARLPDRRPAERRLPGREAERQADHLLLARYAPPGVVIDGRGEIVQFRGRTGAFLEAPPGQPQANVLRMARQGLAAHLHAAIEAARGAVSGVRREGVRIQGPRPLTVNIEVLPLAGIPDSTERYFLVLFEEVPAAEPAGGESAREPAPASPAEVADGAAQEVARLQAELAAAMEYAKSVVSDAGRTADDLATVNEELVSANEELQSTNEELQSAKEELQSTNEELSTLNDELRSRNQDLDRLASDLANILDSIDIPILIVDDALRIRRFTPTFRPIASLLGADVGRPLEDIKLHVHVEGLTRKIEEVIATASAKEWEVQRDDGRWCRLRIRPYRTADNRLDGAILSFVDVDVLKRALQEMEIARDYAQGIIETVPVALVVLDAELRVVLANHAYYERFATSPAEAEGRPFFEVSAGAWRVPALRRAVEAASGGSGRFRDVEIVADLPGAGRKIVCVAGCAVAWNGGGRTILLAIDDVTERRALESERAQLLESEKQARLESERANRTKDLFLATLSHELRTPLSAILLQAQVLQRAALGDARVQRASAAIGRAAANQARLIDDLLDISRIAAGKLLLDLGAVDLGSVVQGAADLARATAEAKALRLDVVIDEPVGFVYGDPARLQQVLLNLLNNSIKFTPPGGRISVHLERLDGRAQITVADTGMGIRRELLPHLFDRFVQDDSSSVRVHGGLGLGLAIVRHLVEVHGGEVRAESLGEGKGATFRVLLPVSAAGSMPSSAPASVSSRSIAGVHVLVVEDDDDARDALCSMLVKLGAEVRCAPSAAEGLRLLAERTPDVILSDIAMPKEDGYSFIRKVRALAPDRGGAVPAAALTALAGEEDRLAAFAAGFQMHLAKPLDAARLASAVSTLATWVKDHPAPAGA